jgi:hypothetical protein
VETEPGAVEAPKRPARVPSQALWVGGADGGVFLVVSPVAASQSGLYDVQVYSDYDGSPLHRGRMRLQPTKRGPFAADQASSYSSWNGDVVHLADGRQLVSVTPKR